jgi:uncharacterized protein YjbI with pentapeptide repeats
MLVQELVRFLPIRLFLIISMLCLLGPCASIVIAAPIEQSPTVMSETFESHEQWLNSDRKLGKKLVLRGREIESLNLTSRHLSAIEFVNCKLTDVVFRDADLSDSSFTECVFTRCRFEASMLQYTVFRNCTITQSDFNKANLNGTTFERTTITDSNLNGASLIDAVCYNTRFNHVLLRGSIFVPKVFSRSYLVESDATNCMLRNQSKDGRLMIAELRDPSAGNSRETDLASEFTGSQFTNVDMSGVRITVRPQTSLSWYGFADAYGLADLVIEGSRSPFFILKADLQAKGLRSSSRELSCAIQRAERSEQSEIHQFLNRLLFDWTCKYGVDFIRPLWLLFLSVVFGTLVILAVSILKPECGRVYTVLRPENSLINRNAVSFSLDRLISSILKAFVASLVSHVRLLGIGEISVKKAVLSFCGDYDDIIVDGNILRPLSAFQALIGVYLIALIIASYVWTPFG